MKFTCKDVAIVLKVTVNRPHQIQTTKPLFFVGFTFLTCLGF